MRQDEETCFFDSTPLDCDIQGIASRESALTQAVITIVADHDETELCAGDPHRRTRSNDDRDAAERGRCVDTIALLSGDLAAGHRDCDSEIFFNVTGVAHRILTGCRNDDDAATGSNR